ncbi:MAG: hypothetical protein OXT09_17830 [Myxococcales bacterium]|nr:hypothetical protein [Myxococcales bacterium]
MTRLTIVFTIWLAGAGVAAAESTYEGPSLRQADTTSYDFEDELVHGDLVAPNGEILTARRKGQRESLIRIREHFIDHLLKSVERL